VAGIEVSGSFDEAPDRAFRPLAGFIDGASRPGCGPTRQEEQWLGSALNALTMYYGDKMTVG